VNKDEKKQKTLNSKKPKGDADDIFQVEDAGSGE